MSSPDLRFEPGPHEYFVNGERLFSVTQVLTLAGMIDTTWFTEEARARGEAAHLACQYDDEGVLDEETLDPSISPYLEGYRKFKEDYQFKPELIESRLWHPQYRYAGTLDRTGTALIRSLGRQTKVVIDLKTGVTMPAYGIQLGAYANLLKQPASYVRLKVELTRAGTYKVYEYKLETLSRHFTVFVSALNVVQWKKEEKLL